MNAIEILKEDHQEVFGFIRELSVADDKTGTDPTDTEVFNKLQQGVKVHSQLEEKIFYPVMQEFAEARNLILSSYQEHNEVDHLLTLLSALAPNERQFQELLRQLRQRLEQHVADEENKVFPLAEQLCDQGKLVEMGKRMVAMKNSDQFVTSTMRS